MIERCQRINATSLAGLRQRIAGLGVITTLQSLKRAVLKANFNPAQPRVQMGLPTGGQWTDAGASADDPAGRIHVAQTRDPSFYFFDFEREYRAGRGHTWPAHVARTREQLIQVLNDEFREVRLPNGSVTYYFHPAEGSFFSTGDASFWVREVLRQNAALVETVIRGIPRVTLTMRFGSQTGIEAYRENPLDAPSVRPTYAVEVIIARDSRPMSHGFRVVTAYPMNNYPNEFSIGGER